MILFNSKTKRAFAPKIRSKILKKWDKLTESDLEKSTGSFKKLIKNDMAAKEIPSENYPNLTHVTERVIQRAIIAKQERKTEKIVNSIDVMLSVLTEFESIVAIRLIELGLTRGKVDSYIRYHSNKYSSVLDHYKDSRLIQRKKLLKVVSIAFFVLAVMIYFTKQFTD